MKKWMKKSIGRKMRCKCGGHIGCVSCDSDESRIRWVSIKEGIPPLKDGVYIVLVGDSYTKKKTMKICKWFGFKTKGSFVYKWINPGFAASRVTHWMPLPEGPNE